MIHNTKSLNIIRNIVEEEGLAKLILDYKKRFEWVEIIKKYTNGDLLTNWHLLTKNVELSEEFIHEFKDDINWVYICIYQTISERFIEEHKSYIHWIYISKHQRLTQHFIHKYRDVLNWDLICTYQRLSSKFIEDHYRYVKWLKIVNHQNGLDAGFLSRHRYDIRRDMDNMEYHDIPENFFENID